jgi:hypothetical protein
MQQPVLKKISFSKILNALPINAASAAKYQLQQKTLRPRNKSTALKGGNLDKN